MRDMSQMLLVVLLMSGDVEQNPGPFPWDKNDEKVEELQNLVEDHTDEMADLKDLVDGQGERIEDLEKKVEELLEQVREERSEAEGTKQEIAKINERLDIRDVRTEEMFEKLTLQNKTIGDEMLIQKVVSRLSTSKYPINPPIMLGSFTEWRMINYSNVVSQETLNSALTEIMRDLNLLKSSLTDNVELIGVTARETAIKVNKVFWMFCRCL